MHLIDNLIIYGFIALNLIVGVLYGRRVKSIKEYSVSRQNYSEFVIVATVFATVIGGGSTFGIVEKVYFSGFCYALVFCGMALNRVWIGTLISKNLKSFQQCITVSEIMERHYGMQARKMTSFFGILTILGGFSAQTYTIGFMLSQITGISHLLGIMIGCGVLVTYSAFGGMRSVVATDVLQFCFIFALIPILLFMAAENQNQLTVFQQAFDSIVLKNFDIDMIGSFFVLLLASGDPAFLQRIFLSKNVGLISRSIRMTGYVSIVFYVIMGLLGILASQVMPGVDHSPLVPIIEKYIPIGFKGILLCSLLAAIMSTADSGLNMIGISCGSDFNKNLSPQKKLVVARISTVLIGLFASVVATQFKNILDIIVFGLDLLQKVI